MLVCIYDNNRNQTEQKVTNDTDAVFVFFLFSGGFRIIAKMVVLDAVCLGFRV